MILQNQCVFLWDKIGCYTSLGSILLQNSVPVFVKFTGTNDHRHTITIDLRLKMKICDGNNALQAW